MRSRRNNAVLWKTGGWLACDPFEETSPGSRTYLATVCRGVEGSGLSPLNLVPARAAFRVVKVTDPGLKVSQGATLMMAVSVLAEARHVKSVARNRSRGPPARRKEHRRSTRGSEYTESPGKRTARRRPQAVGLLPLIPDDLLERRVRHMLWQSPPEAISLSGFSFFPWCTRD